MFLDINSNASVKNSILKRWFDIPLFLPYINLLQTIPLTTRILKAKFIDIEPLRAVISQWIVKLLAIEIFEILTLRSINSVEDIISSPQLPNKIRKLRSHQSLKKNDKSYISEFIRIWIPIILKRIGPNMRNQIIDIIEYSLKDSINLIPNSSKNKKIFWLKVQNQQ